MSKFAFAFLFLCSSAFGQDITVPAEIKPPTPFVCPITLPPSDVADQAVKFSSDPGTGFIRVSDTELHVGTTPGARWLQAEGESEKHETKVVLTPGPTWLIDKSDVKLETIVMRIVRTPWKVRKDFTVEGEPPPPVPLKPLAVMVGDKDKAQKLGSMYADMLAGVKAGSFEKVKPTDRNPLLVFRDVHTDRLTLLGLAGNGAAAEIDRRLNVVLVEPWDAVKVGSVLAEFVSELGVKPDDPDDPPPVDPNATPVSFDGFHVVFLDESGDRPTWLYDLTALPSVETYLNTYCAGGAKGWRRWDKDTPLDNAPPNLRELAKLSKGAAPAVVIAAHKRAVVLPLTKQSEAELLATLKKFGGA